MPLARAAAGAPHARGSSGTAADAGAVLVHGNSAWELDRCGTHATGAGEEREGGALCQLKLSPVVGEGTSRHVAVACEYGW